MMIVTGAAGFLGSCMISKLNQHNFNYIIAVDDFGNPDMELNLHQKKVQERILTNQLLQWLEKNYREVEFIFQFENTTEDINNQYVTRNEVHLNLSQELWQKCVDYQIPFIFSLSQTIEKKNSLPFSASFEQWILQQQKAPFFWAGITVPEVYGPNEYYLGESASIIYRLFNRWQKEKNFGENMLGKDTPEQDYVYVKDVVEVCYFLMHHRQKSGIYPVSTGKLYSLDHIKEVLNFILSNNDPISDYHSAQEKSNNDLSMLHSAGYDKPVRSLQEGLSDYVVNYLQKNDYY